MGIMRMNDVDIFLSIFFTIILIVFWKKNKGDKYDKMINSFVIKSFILFGSIMLLIELFNDFRVVVVIIALLNVKSLWSSFKKIKIIESRKNYKSKFIEKFIPFRLAFWKYKGAVMNKYTKTKLPFPRLYFLIILLDIFSTFKLLIGSMNWFVLSVILGLNIYLCFYLWRNNIIFTPIIACVIMLLFLKIGIISMITHIMLITSVLILLAFDKMDTIKRNYRREEIGEDYFTQ